MPRYGSARRLRILPSRRLRSYGGAQTAGGPFPGTGLLDTFNRANEGPPPSASYTTPVGYSGRSVAGNVCVASAIDNGFIWNTVYAADQEVYVTLTVPPVDGQGIRLVVRNQSDTTLGDAYYAEFVRQGAGINGIVRLFRYIALTPTQLGLDINLGAELGTQQLGLRIVGSTLTVWRDGILLATRTDGVLNAAGRLMVNCTDATCVFDNLGGGAV